MSTPDFPTVPVATNGLEGWSSCCGAAVTYSIADGEPVLCCKACWNEVLTVPAYGDVGAELGDIIDRVIRGALDADVGVALQRSLLAIVPEPDACPVCGSTDLGVFTSDGDDREDEADLVECEACKWTAPLNVHGAHALVRDETA